VRIAKLVGRITFAWSVLVTVFCFLIASAGVWAAYISLLAFPICVLGLIGAQSSRVLTWLAAGGLIAFSFEPHHAGIVFVPSALGYLVAAIAQTFDSRRQVGTSANGGHA
jgi:hypothetical protein